MAIDIVNIWFFKLIFYIFDYNFLFKLLNRLKRIFPIFLESLYRKVFETNSICIENSLASCTTMLDSAAVDFFLLRCPSIKTSHRCVKS